MLQRESAEITRVNALKSINCKINSGERVALIGHNGSGKTSFLKVISGIYFATSGILKKDFKVFPMINKEFFNKQ